MVEILHQGRGSRGNNLENILSIRENDRGRREEGVEIEGGGDDQSVCLQSAFT